MKKESFYPSEAAVFTNHDHKQSTQSLLSHDTELQAVSATLPMPAPKTRDADPKPAPIASARSDAQDSKTPFYQWEKFRNGV